MIVVRCFGHIGTSVGAKEVSLDEEELPAPEVVERLRRLSGKEEPGFNRFNTILMLEDGEAFVPASGDRRVKAGDRVVLIPFSHGG